MTMIRQFASTLELTESADGITEVAGRIFPFGETTHIREPTVDGVDEYDEEFVPGCTTKIRQAAKARGGAPGWIAYTVDHGQSFADRIGYCTALSELDDGAYASFRLDHDPPRLPKIRSMLSTSHTGFSIEFDDWPTPLTGPLRRHRQITIVKVTATAIPVYATAGIMAMRGDDDPLNVGTPRLDAARAIIATWQGSEPATVPA